MSYFQYMKRGTKDMKPRIFVSSTFYDLQYIREDLSNYIKSHDFDPIMFEDGDIGYTPGKALDKSCYETMKSSDMVLLIIGGLYGSPASGENKESFKEYISVTRNEFRTAVNEGIPVFVFIDAKVYSEYAVYEMNMKAIEENAVSIKFSATKDINIFRFIKEIKSIGNIAIVEFLKLTQIKEFLSKQWSDMFKKYLDILKEEKADQKLENTVDEMKSLISRMDTMLDGIGKKVLGENNNVKYSEVVEEIEIAKICDILSNGFSTSEFEKDNKEANLKYFLGAIRKLLSNLSSIKENEDDSEYNRKVHELYSNEVMTHGAFSCSSSPNYYLLYLEHLRRLEQDEVYEKVKEKMKEDRYYVKVFGEL